LEISFLPCLEKPDRSESPDLKERKGHMIASSLHSIPTILHPCPKTSFSFFKIAQDEIFP
jgi:hypothetical protein